MGDWKKKLGDRFEEMFFHGPDASFEEIKKVKRNIYMAVAGLAAAVLLLLFAVWGISSMARPAAVRVQQGEPVYVRIEPGMSSEAIGKLLLKKGVIDSTTKFWLATKLNGADSKFQVGIFQLQHGMSAGEAIEALIHGKTVAVRVTIPEGLNVREVAKLFAKEGLADEEAFLKEAKTFAPYDYIQAVPEADYRIEGFLFPDTYEFANEATPRELMQRMADEFDKKLTPELRELAKAEKLSIYELVTMASLVEKEARYAEDRPIIAQVFQTRLSINMPLQTDTTLQYLMDAPKEDVTIADTKLESPYNTYQHYGLPPGPIASPGLASIEAVLKPADTDYLYFVADREGHNHYSRSYDQHLALVNQVR